MAERKADRHPSIPNGYHIQVDDQQLGRFPHQSALVVVLGSAHAGFEVHQKDIPAALAGVKHQQKEIHWLNNFGLKRAGQTGFAGSVPEYTLLLEAVEGASFVFYDGRQVRPLSVSPSAQHAGKVAAVLALGDPPVGWVG